MKDIKPGDVEIKKCMLKSLDGKRSFNMMGQISVIDIGESITQPLIVGELIIEDGIGLRGGFPIIGEEMVEISFLTPTLEQRNYKLNVYSVGNVQYLNGGKTQQYSLYVVSQEGYNNSSTLISRRLNNTISESIKSIVQDDLKTSKAIQVDDTVGIDKQLISNLTPLQAIDKLRHRAISSQYASSSFVFYEDQKGFHFTTLEKLLKDAQKPTKTYYYDNILDVDINQVRFRDLINYSPVQVQNTMQRLSQGAIRNVVKKFDLITGNITDVEFDAKTLGDVFAKTGKNARDTSTDFVGKYNSKPARKMFMPFSSDTGTEEIADKKSTLQAFVAKISQNIIHITIHGDSSMYLGEPIRCVITTGKGLTEDRKMTTQNNYVVTKIRHTIVSRNRPVYTQTCEIINNSFDS